MLHENCLSIGVNYYKLKTNTHCIWSVTEEDGLEGLVKEYVPVPIPVPVYVPVPMNLYAQATPTSVPIPVPVRAFLSITEMLKLISIIWVICYL